MDHLLLEEMSFFNEVERTGKADVRKTEFLAADDAFEATIDEKEKEEEEIQAGKYRSPDICQCLN